MKLLYWLLLTLLLMAGIMVIFTGLFGWDAYFVGGFAFVVGGYLAKQAVTA